MSRNEKSKRLAEEASVDYLSAFTESANIIQLYTIPEDRMYIVN